MWWEDNESFANRVSSAVVHCIKQRVFSHDTAPCHTGVRTSVVIYSWEIWWIQTAVLLRLRILQCSLEKINNKDDNKSNKYQEQLYYRVSLYMVFHSHMHVSLKNHTKKQTRIHIFISWISTCFFLPSQNKKASY